MKRIQDHDEGSVLTVRVLPRARKSVLAGWHDNALKVRLAAPPVEGKANLALIAFLAKALGIRKQQIELLSGDHSRQKRLLIRDLTAEEVCAQLGLDQQSPA